MPNSVTIRRYTFRVQESIYESFWRKAANGAWEPETLDLLERFLDRQHAYLDLGAWIGPTVLYASQLASVVYALEPDPAAFAELRANIELNQPQLANAQIYNQAIASFTGKIRLGTPTRAGDSSATILKRPTTQAWQVDAIRLDDFIAQADVRACNFIKMDIEGGEFQVLASMTAWLQEFRPTLYLSLHPYQLYWSGWRVFRLAPKLREAMVAIRTAALLDTLRFYSNCYTARGESITRAEIVAGARRLENSAFIFSDLP